MFFWEPVPGVCTPDDWKGCIEAMQTVDMTSPNITEAAEFLGRTIDEELDFRSFKIQVEEMAEEYIRYIGDRAVVFRCGKHGCLVAKATLMKWLPAYHQSKEKVVDPTGGGNAFCGGFCIGWIQSGGDILHAAKCGNIAASLVIEQFGLPHLEYVGDKERWNGDTVEEREDFYHYIMADINQTI
jgi:sugar/nucleoside kinase (ribokinase family)